MKALRLSGSAESPALIATEIPALKPERGEVAVRVYAAGVTPTEVIWYPTTHTKDGGPRTGAVPAHEFCGEISAIGEGVSGWEVGREVYGMNDWFADGALAEYCITRPEWIAPKPRSLSHAEAASVPIGVLTAWQGLLDRAHLRTGERVLIHGGAGAVGVYAIQLARRCETHVMTTVSSRDFEFVRELGADEVIDYRAQRFEDAVREVDVVFDAVGGDTLRRSWGVLNRNGRLVTIAASSEATRDEREKAAFFIVEPNREQLTEIAGLLNARELRAVVDRVVPFSQAADAYAGTVERRGRGKLVAAVAG